MTAGWSGRWEGYDGDALAARWGAPAVHAFAAVGSSNDVARRLAAGGAPDGSVVLAEEQTAGRGRVGRAWSSPPGLGLWISVVRRPAADFLPGPLPLRVGLAAAAALDPFLAPASAALKWPNDLLAAGRKLAGILCEAVWEGDRTTAVVVGIGLNVLHADDDFPEALRASATSVAIASGAAPSRLAVADALVPAILGVPLGGPLSELERAGFGARDALRGHEVDVLDPITGDPHLRGVSGGIGADGALLVRLADGAERAVHSGTVRLAAAVSHSPA